MDLAGHDKKSEAKPSRYWRPQVWVDGERGPDYGPDVFGPDLYVDALAAAIDHVHADPSQPLFAYFPMALPHLPLVPTPAERDAFDATPTDDQRWAGWRAMQMP